MSEGKPDLKVVENPKTAIRIICNEGPPQVTVAYLRLDHGSMIAAPGMPPPIKVEHATMRPVLVPERPGCGRHRFDDNEDDGWDRKGGRNCGNCRFGEKTEIELRSEDR